MIVLRSETLSALLHLNWFVWNFERAYFLSYIGLFVEYDLRCSQWWLHGNIKRWVGVFNFFTSRLLIPHNVRICIAVSMLEVRHSLVLFMVFTALGSQCWLWNQIIVINTNIFIFRAADVICIPVFTHVVADKDTPMWRFVYGSVWSYPWWNYVMHARSAARSRRRVMITQNNVSKTFFFVNFSSFGLLLCCCIYALSLSLFSSQSRVRSVICCCSYRCFIWREGFSGLYSLARAWCSWS